VWAGEGYQGQYPLLVSDRYLIVEAALKRAAELGTRTIAHGCTGMGNDQVRFDLTVKALGDYEILAPIREIQKEHAQVRAYEQAYLEARGFGVREQAEGLHHQREPARSHHVRRRDRPLAGAGRAARAAGALRAPSGRLEPASVTIGFEQGEAGTLDGEALPGHACWRAQHPVSPPTAWAAASTPGTPR
jgi:argininosuccinate synthase